MGRPLALPWLSDGVIVLRAFRDADVALVQQVASDPLIPLITTVPSTPDAESALAFIARQHSRAQSGVGYSFAIADATTGDAIGQIGLWLRDLCEGRASVGYWVAERYRRRGVARSALALVSAWALEHRGVARLELYVEPWNEGSWRSAERVGFRREGLLRSWQRVGEQRRDMYMYSLLATDALPSEARPVDGG